MIKPSGFSGMRAAKAASTSPSRTAGIIWSRTFRALAACSISGGLVGSRSTPMSLASGTTSNSIFKKLWRQLDGHHADPGQVTAWAGETGDDAERDRITGAVENDRDRRGRLLCGEGGRVAAFGDDDVNLAGNQLSSQGGQPIEVPLRPAVFDRDVLPFNKTSLGQSLEKSREVQ